MDAPPRLTYPLTFDPVAYKSCNLALLRKNWRAWTRKSLKTGFGLGVVLASGFVFGAAYARMAGHYYGLLVVFLIGFAWGCVSPVYGLLKRLNTAKAAEGLTWATISDEGWTTTQPSGIAHFVPWSAMTLTLAHEGGWVVRVGKSEQVVNRQSLRTAGLEMEFISRLRASGKVSL